MASETVTLRFGGGGSLTFRDGLGVHRRVQKGEPFDVDAETAVILLATDAGVERIWPSPAEPMALEDLTVAQLRERADALGLEVPAKTRKADLVTAIEEAKVTPEAEDPREAVDPEDDLAPDEPEEHLDEEGDPIPPPAESTDGTIRLGDLPPSARIAPEQG